MCICSILLLQSTMRHWMRYVHCVCVCVYSMYSMYDVWRVLLKAHNRRKLVNAPSWHVKSDEKGGKVNKLNQNVSIQNEGYFITVSFIIENQLIIVKMQAHQCYYLQICYAQLCDLHHFVCVCCIRYVMILLCVTRLFLQI